MPKLKQPTPLGKMALDVLHEFVLQYCDRLSVEGTLNEFRQGVSIIKQRVCNYIPWYLLADFSSQFLEDFYSDKRPASHGIAALEILMDIEIIGLRCKGPILAHLNPKDVRRFRKLEELDLCYFPASTPLGLHNFHLEDLTTFNFPNACTNHDLNIIGKNCSKLQVLKVRESKVTDEGLSALSSCSELRVVDIVGCAVSYSGINTLLSVNKKIEEFAHWDGTSHLNGCEVLSHLDSSVCLSISRFVFQNDRDVRPVDLKAIVAKFPNLTDLEMNCAIAEDLISLQHLDKLTKLEIHFVYEMYYDEVEQTWASMKELLRLIGANITTLKLSCYDQGFLWYQEDLNFLFNSCPNIEYLGFDQGGGIVTIPPFPKLKELIPRIPIEFEQIEILEDPGLEFGIMSSLETLSLLNYGMNFKSINNIMLDDVKFPNLSVVETNCVKAEELLQIELIARNNNLDFKVKNDPESNWYFEYRFCVMANTDDDEDDDDNDDTT